MTSDTQKLDDPYGGFNDYDHAYDLGVSVQTISSNISISQSLISRMFTRMQNLCGQSLVQVMAGDR